MRRDASLSAGLFTTVTSRSLTLLFFWFFYFLFGYENDQVQILFQAYKFTAKHVKFNDLAYAKSLAIVEQLIYQAVVLIPCFAVIYC